MNAKNGVWLLKVFYILLNKIFLLFDSYYYIKKKKSLLSILLVDFIQM